MLNHDKIIIMPSQAVLLLIEKYSKQDDIEKVLQLKRLYLLGAVTKKEVQTLRILFQDEALSEYAVSFAYDAINSDPTRRYFETHLAHRTLIHGLQDVDQQDLDAHVKELKGLLEPNMLRLNAPANINEKIQQILAGSSDEKDELLFKEYADYLFRIKHHQLFDNLTDEERVKLILLVQSSFLGVMAARYSREQLPLDIYGSGIFSKENKGKIEITDQQSTRNQNFGLMKGHMPLPLDDIAHSQIPFHYLKPSDQATYDPNTVWVRDSSSRMVHPFSNSISGTMLCQLRSFAFLRRKRGEECIKSSQYLSCFSRLMISAMLFYSGGHTLHEFTAPFTLDQSRREFSSLQGFSGINLESMFLTDNLPAYNEALSETFQYNRSILKRAAVVAQVKSYTTLCGMITSEIEAYKQRVSTQWFCKFRSGFKKVNLIQTAMRDLVEDIRLMHFQAVRAKITRLKLNLISRFGQNNSFGRSSKALELVNRLSAEIEFSIQRTYQDTRKNSHISVNMDSCVNGRLPRTGSAPFHFFTAHEMVQEELLTGIHLRGR